MSLPGLFIARPVMTVLVMAAIAGLGLMAWLRLPVSDLPRIDFPTISVSASLPGADPETMATAVANPLERQFSTISGVDSMTSSSIRGSTTITLQFALERDIDAAAQDVQAAIAATARRLPSEMPSPPTWRKTNPTELPVLIVALRSDTLPLPEVNELADTLIAQRLSTLPGVAQVRIFGEQKRAVRVQADPERLAAMDLAFDDLAGAIERANSNRPSGMVWGPRQAWTVTTDAALDRAAEFRPLVVAWRNGAPVRLEQVAAVFESVENDKTASWSRDTRAIVVAVDRQPGANTIAVVDGVRAQLDELGGRLPAQVEMEVLIDRSLPIRASVADVQHTLLLTAALVVLVIFAFLRRVSATLIPALSLPLSLLGTFAAMWALDFSLDNLSLMALTLATGFVVDDAIVVLEAIVRRIEDGEDPATAAREGSARIAFTVVSMTVSLAAVFIPVLFMGGLLGRLFQEFAATVMIAIGVSGFVSLTLVPMLCARFLRAGARPHAEESGGAFALVERLYARALDVCLRHRRWVLASLAASLALTWVIARQVPTGLIPNEDLGQVRVVLEAGPDASFADMCRRQQEVAAIVLRDPDVATFMSSAGGNDGVNRGTMFLRLRDAPARTVTPEVVADRLRAAVAGIPGVIVRPQVPPPIRIGGRMSDGLYQYTLQGTDGAELQRAGQEMLDKVRAIPACVDVGSDLKLNNPRVVVRIDRDRAAALGVSPARIEATLGAALGSVQVSTIYADTNQFQVILEADPASQASPAMLGRLRIRPDQGGALVPLEAVARISTAVGPLSVNHQGQLPAVTISFNLATGASLGPAMAAIEAAAATLPATVSGGFAGAAKVGQSSMAGMAALLVLSIAVIYVVLGILYESFIHPLTILSGLPSAGVGALLALWIFGGELNVFSFIGIIMLVGIVKKNAIMMVDYAIQARARDGLDALTAIRRGCLVRFRPIMMTTLAALMGTLPLAIGLGTASNSRWSLGVAVVGGLLLSQLITLFITPVVYLYLDRVQEAIGRRMRSEVAVA
jgi:HAE1 family hydrophobic/amphiphilic exporter-1